MNYNINNAYGDDKEEDLLINYEHKTYPRNIMKFFSKLALFITIIYSIFEIVYGAVNHDINNCGPKSTDSSSGLPVWAFLIVDGILKGVTGIPIQLNIVKKITNNDIGLIFEKSYVRFLYSVNLLCIILWGIIVAGVLYFNNCHYSGFSHLKISLLASLITNIFLVIVILFVIYVMTRAKIVM